MIRWSDEKAEKLKAARKIDIKEIAKMIESENFVAIEKVKNQEGHPNQMMFIVIFKGYAHCVPFVVEENGDIFLKTVFKSRAMQAKYNGQLKSATEN